MGQLIRVENIKGLSLHQVAKKYGLKNRICGYCTNPLKGLFVITVHVYKTDQHCDHYLKNKDSNANLFTKVKKNKNKKGSILCLLKYLLEDRNLTCEAIAAVFGLFKQNRIYLFKIIVF